MNQEEMNINEEELKDAPQEETVETQETPEASETAQEPDLQSLIDELKKQLLYKAAEFENFRKRTIAEKTELILNGGERVITAILPVLDDMERAIANAPKTDDIAALEEGWELIAKKLHKILEGQGVKPIDTADADFDTDFHEAVAMVPGMGDEKKGKVIDCVQTGYTLNDKVIRHAKVAVGQ